MSGIGLDAVTQALDERVHAAHGHEGIAAPDLREQRFATEHDALVAREQVQQTEFLIGQLDVASLDPHAPPLGVDFDAANEQRWPSVRCPT